MASSRERRAEDDRVDLAGTFRSAVGGEARADIGTVHDLTVFLDAVTAAELEPDGVRPAGAIWTAGTGAPVVEFAQFDDCAFLRCGTDIATEPGFFHTGGVNPAEFTRQGERRIRGCTGDVETLPPEALLCTPGWVREQVLAFAMTGAMPRGIGWRQRVRAGTSARKAVWRWHGGWRAS